MKKTISVLLFFICMGLSFTEIRAAESLTPFEKNELWGYQDAQGQVVIKPRYQLAEKFNSEGIAAVVDQEGWAYINNRGKILIRPFVFDNGPDYFREGLARFTEKGRFGFFNRRGQVVIKAQFDFALPFHEGLAVAALNCRMIGEDEHRRTEGGKWGYIDKTGKWIIAPVFSAAESFVQGQAKVKLRGVVKVINKKGEVLGDAEETKTHGETLPFIYEPKDRAIGK